MTMETNGKQKVKLLHLYKLQLDFSRLPNVTYYGCKKLYSAVQVIVRKCILLLDKERKTGATGAMGVAHKPRQHLTYTHAHTKGKRRLLQGANIPSITPHLVFFFSVVSCQNASFLKSMPKSYSSYSALCQ